MPPDLSPLAGPQTILAERFLAEDTLSLIALRRAVSDPPFSDRERHVTTLVFDEIPWLHFRDWPPPPLPMLSSPRQQRILDLLLSGMSRKEIAHKLEVAPGTVAGYCREIYRRLRVNSQSELIRQTRRKNPSSK